MHNATVSASISDGLEIPTRHLLNVASISDAIPVSISGNSAVVVTSSSPDVRVSASISDGLEQPNCRL